MNKPLVDVLKEATQDLLSPESLSAISEAFKAQVDATVATQLNETVEKQVNERVESAVTKALQEQDQEYADKLEKLLEAVDADHTLKLEKIIARIDENHSVKLRNLVEKYNNEAKLAAEQFKSSLVDKISRFIDIRLNEAIPTEQIVEAVKNTRSKKIIKAIQEAVAVDERFINSEIRTALQDGKKQIDEGKTLVADLQKQVKVLSEKTRTLQANLLLEQKTSGLPKEKKDYVFKVLSNKDEKFINENFVHVVDMFEKAETEEVETLKETAVSKTKSVDQPTEVIEENVEQIDPNVASYMEELK